MFLLLEKSGGVNHYDSWIHFKEWLDSFILNCQYLQQNTHKSVSSQENRNHSWNCREKRFNTGIDHKDIRRNGKTKEKEYNKRYQESLLVQLTVSPKEDTQGSTRAATKMLLLHQMPGSGITSCHCCYSPWNNHLKQKALLFLPSDILSSFTLVEIKKKPDGRGAWGK